MSHSPHSSQQLGHWDRSQHWCWCWWPGVVMWPQQNFRGLETMLELGTLGPAAAAPGLKWFKMRPHHQQQQHNTIISLTCAVCMMNAAC